MCSFPNWQINWMCLEVIMRKNSLLDTCALYEPPTQVRVHTTRALNLYLMGAVMGG